MCGIAGFYHIKGGRPDIRLLKSILEAQQHRGPDNLGLFSNKSTAIGNVRLAIQGPDEAGNQPIFNEDGSLAVVMAGEIYNYPDLKAKLEEDGHRFSSRTDTEVILHLYEEEGLNLLDKLNGMFTFALFDIGNNELVLARDRTGQKPLYIYECEDYLCFSSELAPLLQCLDKPEIDPGALVEFLSLGYVCEPSTIFRKVRSLSAGNYLRINQAGTDERTYWRPLEHGHDLIVDERQWLEESDTIFRRALSRHLLSDMPVTMFLSGGIDSSLMLLYAVESAPISEVFTGSFIDTPDFDEFDRAAELGPHCGVRINRVPLTRKILSESLEKFVKRSSMPIGDTSVLATFCLAEETAGKYRVVIGGDGGDELFCGYPTYSLPYYKKWAWWIPRCMIRLSGKAARLFESPGTYMPLSFKLQQVSAAWPHSAPVAHFHLKNSLPPTVSRAILSEDLQHETRTDAIEANFTTIFNKTSFQSTIRRLCWLDINTFLTSGTIPKTERQCMRFSLESRMPFLDNEIIRLSLSTSPELMYGHGKTKLCLRKLLEHKMPGLSLTGLGKQGFTPPIADMLNSELNDWRKNWLDYKSPFFKTGVSEKMDRFRKEGWNLHRLEWAIAVFNHWCCLHLASR